MNKDMEESVVLLFSAASEDDIAEMESLLVEFGLIREIRKAGRR